MLNFAGLVSGRKQAVRMLLRPPNTSWCGFLHSQPAVTAVATGSHLHSTHTAIFTLCAMPSKMLKVGFPEGKHCVPCNMCHEISFPLLKISATSTWDAVKMWAWRCPFSANRRWPRSDSQKQLPKPSEKPSNVHISM